MLIFGLMVAGAIGASSRFLVDLLVQEKVSSTRAFGTLVINVSGSLLLGFLTGLTLYHAFPATAKTVLGTGFCGAYTTFSTFAYETEQLGEDGASRQASLNVAASLVVPVLAAAAGLALATL
jgi:CrcB protein